MHKLSLPRINLQLPDFPDKETVLFWQKQSAKLAEKATHTGMASTALKNRQFKIIQTITQGYTSPTSLIAKPIDIRATVSLWANDNHVYKLLPISKDLLDRFVELRPKFSISVLTYLINIFFEKYKQCGALDALIDCLSKQLSRQKNKLINTGLSKLSMYSTEVISKKGPQFLVNKAVESKLELSTVLEAHGVPRNKGSNYVNTCNLLYYLSCLNKLTIGEDSNLFSELCKKEVKIALFDNQYRIGHKVIDLLVNKCIQSNLSIPENWQKVILSIAGDPRAPKSSDNFRHWWMPLNSKVIDAVRSCLSKVDLDLFLKTLQDYAKRENNKKILRMYPKRRHFLKGLFDHDLVVDSRLFVGNNIESYLKRNFQEDELPSYVKLSDSRDLCAIYINLGTAHILEGSHDFTMRIYDQLPPRSTITNYGITQLNGSDLRTKLQKEYQRHFPRMTDIPKQVKHTHGKLWQRDVISILKSMGIGVKPEWLLDGNDLKEYRKDYIY